ncbi:MAG: hypothetical protein KF696_08695 [Planctomycetes bacterium]|nr:hypothetical protein [Planctomycetota bacterium]MCW8136675.1 hypothetical protein [Planctomycetota bacterium]
MQTDVGRIDWRKTNGTRSGLLGTAACILVLCVISQPLLAGPNRKAVVVGESEGAGQNLAWPGYGHPDQPFDQNGGDALTNHGYLRADPDSFKTYVNGEVVIWYLAAGGAWIRKYGLFGYDTWERPIQINNCELGRFVYDAKASIRVSAEAALTRGMHETGDVFACASASLRFSVDDAVVAYDSKQAMAGTRNLELADKPLIVSGPYTYEGKPAAGDAKAKVANDGVNPAIAVIDASVTHGGTKAGLNAKFSIRSYGDVRVNVTETDYGWGRARVKHVSYPHPDTSGKYAGNGNSTNEYWKVTVEAWDYDLPGNPIRIRKFEWTKWGDE